MSFSGFTRLNQVSGMLSTSAGARIVPKLQTGGAFSPNTIETLYAMRSQMDNQMDDNFVIKYRTTMQNRLNYVAQQLRDAYTALLNTSATQLVGEGLYAPGRTDVAGIDYHEYADSVGKDLYTDWGVGTDTEDSSMPDAMNSYRRSFVGGGPSIEMRRLGASGAAMDQHNNVGITMRSEEIPFDSSGFMDGLADFGRFLSGGDPPFRARQKVAEYKSELATGGFWSTLNYLYSFNPRQLKYSYATSYTVNSEEAGTRSEQGNDEGYLFQAKLTDGQDGPDFYGKDQFEDEGYRVKWSSTNSNDGYLTETSAFDGDRDIYDRLNDTTRSAETITVAGQSSVLVDGVLYQNDSSDDKQFSTLTTNHFQVTKQSFSFNSTGSTDGTMDATESILTSKGIMGGKDPEKIDGEESTLPGSGNITQNFTQAVWDDFFTLESYNDQEVLGNGTNPFIGEMELAAYEGLDRALAMSKGFMTAELAGTPSVSEINASNVVPTDWYFAENKGGGDLWFPFVQGTVYGTPAIPNDTQYASQRAQFRKVIDLTDAEYDAIDDTNGLTVTLDCPGAGDAFLVVNGDVINLSGGGPVDINIPKSALAKGENIFGIEYVTGAAENESVNLQLKNVDLPAATYSALSARIDTDGGGSESAEQANYWQSRLIPTTRPALNVNSVLDEFKVRTLGSEVQEANPLAVIIMETLNDPRYQDIFRLGLLRDLVVKGIANTPNGSTLNGSISFTYDTTRRKLNLTQTRLTAKQGS